MTPTKCSVLLQCTWEPNHLLTCVLAWSSAICLASVKPAGFLTITLVYWKRMLSSWLPVLSTNGQMAKVSHTHCKGKAQAKRVRQSSLPSMDSDSARSGLFQIETSSTLLMFTSNLTHCSFKSLTFSLITVTHGFYKNTSLTRLCLCFYLLSGTVDYFLID